MPAYAYIFAGQVMALAAPPPPSSADAYMTCVAATARVEAKKGMSDKLIMAEAEYGCGHFADEVPETATALREAGKARALLIARTVRAETKDDNAPNQ